MFNFMRWRWVYALISAILIIPGLISLGLFGLKPGMDFTGGTFLEVTLPQFETASNGLTESISPILPDAQITEVGSNTFQIKTSNSEENLRPLLLEVLESNFGTVQVLRFESLGPSIGQELLLKTGAAIVLALLVILLYVAKQFNQLKYGIFAIVAMLHDVLVLIGAFSLLGYFLGVEITVLFVTALLTALSFSVHDTIVVFDRIRELQKSHSKEKRVTIINAAIWQTLSRSLNNSVTLIIMLLALVLLGGETIRWFAVALLIGAVTGTYSSTFVAVPLLYTWEEVSPKISNLFTNIPSRKRK